MLLVRRVGFSTCALVLLSLRTRVHGSIATHLKITGPHFKLAPSLPFSPGVHLSTGPTKVWSVDSRFRTQFVGLPHRLGRCAHVDPKVKGGQRIFVHVFLVTSYP